MTRAAIYTRVSSDPRGVGRSVAEQEADCRSIAAREGWNIIGVWCDNDRSASRYARNGRPAWEQLVAEVAAGKVDVLVTWEASRAQRDLEAYVQLRELCRQHQVLWSYSGTTYDLSTTDDAFRTGLDALLAERESSLTRDRVLRAVRSNATKGRPHGKRPYGYDRTYDPTTGVLDRQIINEPQAAVIREAARRVAAGETTYAVANSLNDRGIPAPRAGTLFTRKVEAADARRHGWEVVDQLGGGWVKAKVPAHGRWSAEQIRRLLISPVYIAKRVHLGKIVADGDWPPILDEALFWQLHAKLTDPARRTQRDSAVKHLLSGIATCGVCGAVVRVLLNRNYPAYICKHAFHVSRSKRQTDAWVQEVVVELLERTPAVLEPDDTADTRAGELAELQARLDGFVEAAAAGELSPSALAKVEARLMPQIEALRRSLRPARSPLFADLAGNGAGDRWEKLEVAAKRELIRELVTVTLLPGRSGTFDPETVKVDPRPLV